MKAPHLSPQVQTSGFLSKPLWLEDTTRDVPSWLMAFSVLPRMGFPGSCLVFGSGHLDSRTACPCLRWGQALTDLRRGWGEDTGLQRPLPRFRPGSASSLPCDPALGYLPSSRVSLSISKMGLIIVEPVCGAVWGINREIPQFAQRWAHGPVCGIRRLSGWGQASKWVALPSDP